MVAMAGAGTDQPPRQWQPPSWVTWYRGSGRSLRWLVKHLRLQRHTRSARALSFGLFTDRGDNCAKRSAHAVPRSNASSQSGLLHIRVGFDRLPLAGLLLSRLLLAGHIGIIGSRRGLTRFAWHLESRFSEPMWRV